jgi:hypothetical protein
MLRPHDADRRDSTWRTSLIGFFKQRNRRSRRSEVRSKRLAISRPLPVDGEFVPLFLAAEMVMAGDAIAAKQENLERRFGLGSETKTETNIGKSMEPGTAHQREDSMEPLSAKPVTHRHEAEHQHDSHPLQQNAIANVTQDSEPSKPIPWLLDDSVIHQQYIATTGDSSPSTSPIWEPIRTFQTHLFALPLELRNQIYDYVLDISSHPDFSNQEPLKYNISPALGYPNLENYSSISVNMSRSWAAADPDEWCYGLPEDEESWVIGQCIQGMQPSGRMIEEIKQRFCEHTTFVISMTASLPESWYAADSDGRYSFLDAHNEMQMLYLLSDDSLQPWLQHIRSVKLILVLSTTDGFAAASPGGGNGGYWENLGLVDKSSAGSAAVAKIAWIMQHCANLRKLDISVTLSGCAPTTEEWVWSLLEPLRRIRGVRAVAVNGVTLVKRAEGTISDGTNGETEEVQIERTPDGVCECNGWERFRPAMPLRWERGADEEDEGEDDSPEERYPMFDASGRYRGVVEADKGDRDE